MLKPWLMLSLLLIVLSFLGSRKQALIDVVTDWSPELGSRIRHVNWSALWNAEESFVYENFLDFVIASNDFVVSLVCLSISAAKISSRFSRDYIWPVLFSAHLDFGKLSLKNQLYVIGCLLVNLIILTLWCTGILKRTIVKLAFWHRQIADFCVNFGPYIIIITTIYFPCKRLISTRAAFRSGFQIVIYGVIIARSLQLRNGLGKSSRYMLSFWTILTVFHLLIYPVQWLLERNIPIFNMWYSVINGDRNFNRRNLILTPTYAGVGDDLIMKYLVGVEEVFILTTGLAALIEDEILLRKIRRSIIWGIESVVSTMVGFRFEIAVLRGKPNAFQVWKEAALNSIPINPRIAIPIIQLAPIVLIILPNFILRFFYLGIALVLPLTYSLRAIENLHMGKIQYWTLYYALLLTLGAVEDSLVQSNFIIRSIVHNVRFRYSMVILLQCLCSEPVVLTNWIYQQAQTGIKNVCTPRRHE